jgi:hypothetical protein
LAKSLFDLHQDFSMTVLDKTYYRVIFPFHYLRIIGGTPSNTYIGRSQAITAIFDADNAELDDELHSLPGGLFLARGDELTEIRFTQFPDVTLKDAGDISVPRRIAAMIEHGVLEKLDGPSNKPTNVIRFERERKPEGTPEVTYRQHSVEYGTMWDTFCGLKPKADEHGFKVYLNDMGVFRKVTFQVQDQRRNPLIVAEFGDRWSNPTLQFSTSFALQTGIVGRLQEAIKDDVSHASSNKMRLKFGFEDKPALVDQMEALLIEAMDTYSQTLKPVAGRVL